MMNHVSLSSLSNNDNHEECENNLFKLERFSSYHQTGINFGNHSLLVCVHYKALKRHKRRNESVFIDELSVLSGFKSIS